MKPMLAAKVALALDDKEYDKTNINKLSYPVWVSPKLDGIRAVVDDSKFFSRKLKPIRNKFIQSHLNTSMFNGLDGELIVGDPTHALAYRRSNSGVMSGGGTPDFKYYIFDVWNNDLPYNERYAGLLGMKLPDWAAIVPSVQVHTAEELLKKEKEFLDAGYEGAMIRDPSSLYKYGRSTFREGYLIKMKRYSQEEAVVVDIIPAMQNNNEAVINNLGNIERSKCKENLSPKDVLGKFVVQSSKYRVEFEVSPGNLTDDEKRRILKNKEQYIGKIITYKFFAYGGYDVPRSPIFKGFRDKDDI